MTPENTLEPKALRLARYLRNFVGLRSTTVHDLTQYEAVLWFGDLPQEPECRSPAWCDDLPAGAPWLEVRKQQLPKMPDPAEVILPWIDQQALQRASGSIPELRPTRRVADPDAVIEAGQEAPLIEDPLARHPEVAEQYERYRPAWEAWCTEHRRRERIQAVYAELFRLHTQARKQGEALELVVGLGLLDWRGDPPPVARHVITARVDLTFEPADGIMRLEAARDGVQLKVEDDMLAAELRPDPTQRAAVSEQLSGIDADIWDRARMFTAIKSWAGALHADTQWSDDLHRGPGDASGKPTVTFAPALILRARNPEGMVRIYDSIIAQLASDSGAVPAGWSGLVEDTDDIDVLTSEGQEASGTPSGVPPGQEIYFPLPANHEQRRIVEAIQQRRGVLVQGPPGTGKSHSIANLICHLLASGKRALVTAETSQALKILKDKLPEELRPLCISLLGRSGESFAELNAAVEGITSRYAAWTPGAYDPRIAEIDRELEARRRCLAQIDAQLRSLREGETVTHTLMGGAYQGTASQIAARVASERERLGWLHLPQDPDDRVPVKNADLVAWLGILRRHDEESITRAQLQIVRRERILFPADFAAALARELEARTALDHVAQVRGHRAYAPIMALGSAQRGELAHALKMLRDRRMDIGRQDNGWLQSALRAMLGGRFAVCQQLFDRSQALIGTLIRALDVLGSASVSLPADSDPAAIRSDAAAVMAFLNNGGRWSSWDFVNPRALKERAYLRTDVRVDHQPADSVERLARVCAHLDFRHALKELEQAWANNGGLPAGPHPRIAVEAIREQVEALGQAISYAQSCKRMARHLASLRPAIPEPDWLSAEVESWIDAIDAAGVEEQYRDAGRAFSDSLRELQLVSTLHDAHPSAAALIRAIERRDTVAYDSAYRQVCQVEEIRQDQDERRRTEAALHGSVPGLVEAVAADPVHPSWDERFKAWEDAWRWAVAERWLERRTALTDPQEHWQRRQDTESSIGQLLAEAAGLRAWSHLFLRISRNPSVRAALNGWRSAVQAMGKGTGRSARLERLRREARQYMDQCREAIPVWIMPRYLVAEMIEPTPGRYDLVIVDEASQLGVDSLFLFYIARKIVIVGDDQQISPYGIGISDDAIAGLQRHYLDGIPHRHALSAQSSLYANARIRFGQSVVLREHFRCMPEIIQFSNDLCYASNGTPLDPLRAYPANRLQPLVVRHIAAGSRKGRQHNAVNEPEADAVLAQIAACIQDPRYAGLTMGVISLQGEAQARLIERKMLQRLELEVIEERRLVCGDASAFQGDERHVIFLSMVAAPNKDIGALATDSARQRFNVAASRAQDQLWLFHSATLNDLSPGCMRHKLLSYMMNPQRQKADEALVRFESAFERHVHDLIAARGYRVRTQVCVGDPTEHRYRIDLVVEGMQGRLAVECEGDQWHGPDRYEQDTARQRDLERAGWRFVRIRGGDFYRDPERALEPLWDELQRLGIRPGGVDEAAAPPPPAPGTATQDAERVSRRPGRRKGKRRPDRAASGTPLPASLYLRYTRYRGPAGGDPRSVSREELADGLCRIIEVEGPMIARRAYRVYLRACGIRRMGNEIKSAMNKALSRAIRKGQVLAVNEPGVTGVTHSTVRLAGAPLVKIRTKGRRRFSELPPDELRAVGDSIASTLDVEPLTKQHFRRVLAHYRMRLTTQRASALAAILSTPRSDNPADGRAA